MRCGGIKLKETIVKISMVKMHIVGNLLTIILAFGFILLHALLYEEFEITVTLPGFMYFLIGFIALIFLHEFFHLIGYRIYGKLNWNEMKWGFNWKLMVAYAHAKKEISVSAMKKTLLLPFLPTGVLPVAIGLIFDLPAVTLLGSILIAGCIGDFILYRKLKEFSNDALVKDHPSKPQFTVYH